MTQTTPGLCQSVCASFAGEQWIPETAPAAESCYSPMPHDNPRFLGTLVLSYSYLNCWVRGTVTMGSVADPPHKGKTLHLRRATLLLTLNWKWPWRMVCFRAPEPWELTEEFYASGFMHVLLGSSFLTFRIFLKRVSDHLPTKLRTNDFSPNFLFYRRRNLKAKSLNNLPKPKTMSLPCQNSP